MLHGNKENGQLSLHIQVRKVGNSFLCQPPGNWGKLPEGFKNFWECDTELYLTENVENKDSFVFDSSHAKRLSYTQKNPKDSQTWLCVDIDDTLPIGQHVLTVVPTGEDQVSFAYLLLP